ncbi:GntR family transcriptional regulator [Arthrobacter agilis]|nr:GntR family transcriptional regulator [Arthrobacter agilis]
MRDQLIAFFQNNNVRPGDQIPSEPEIVETFKVGRSTAREAVKLLEHDGLVEVRPGLGRFLTSLATATVERPITRFESVTDLLNGLGYTAQTLVLSVQEDLPNPVEREALKLDDDEKVVRLVRLRSAGDEPLIFSVDTIIRSYIPGPVKHIDWTGSLTTFLQSQGHTLSFSTARLQAVNLPDDVRARYSLDGYDPWFLITETAITATGTPALYAQDYHRGDTFAFNVLRR